MELDAERNVAYTAGIELDEGKYELTFEWAAREGYPLSSSGFEVLWNTDYAARIVPSDY